MERSSRAGTLFWVTLLVVGIIPIVYFVSIEIQIAHAADEKAAEPQDPLSRQIDNVAFGVNEKLTFDIKYGFINAGRATMEVARLIEYNDRPCYQIVTRAQSNSFFSTFYKVDDRVESIVDANGLFSWRFEKRLREGKYRSDRMYEFDPINQVAYYGEDTIETPLYVQDALSVLYFVRTQELRVGDSIFLDNFTDGKLYPLEVRVLKKEDVTVKAGTFECLVVEPLLRSVGVFKHKGRLRVWVTDDRLKMPVLMKSKVLVGSITAELTDYELGEIDVY